MSLAQTNFHPSIQGNRLNLTVLLLISIKFGVAEGRKDLNKRKNLNLTFVFANKKCSSYLAIDGDSLKLKEEDDLTMKNGKTRNPEGRYDKYQHS
jgi:hypothetical protein